MIRLSTLLLARRWGSGCVRAMMTIGSTALRGCRRRWLSVGVAGLGADAAGDAALAGDSGPP